MANTRAKYFCENCGNEVAAKARFCPHCGRFFSSVRCPKCNFAGSVTDFKKGCPKCHYAMTHEDIYGQDAEEPAIPKGKNHFYITKPKKTKTKQKESFYNDTPMWLFIASIVAFFVMVSIIFFKCSD